MSSTEIVWRPSNRANERMGSVSECLDDAFGKVAGNYLVRGPSGWLAQPQLVTDTDASTITLDVGASPNHLVVLGGSRTLALANIVVGQVFRVLVQQGGSGSYAVTWFSTIRWSGATPPTLTTTVGQIDAFGFLCIASGSYINLWQTLNL